jgi:c-di-GMP-binding flagellar brake protein YcgR
VPKKQVRFILAGDESLIDKTLGTERRKWHRLPLALPVFLRSVDGAGKESLEFATGLNVSAGGMLVASRRALPLTGQALLEIPVAPFALPSSASKVSRKLQARIVRVVHGEDFHLIGMRFQRPLPDGSGGRKAGKLKVTSKPARKKVTTKV